MAEPSRKNDHWYLRYKNAHGGQTCLRVLAFLGTAVFFCACSDGSSAQSETFHCSTVGGANNACIEFTNLAGSAVSASEATCGGGAWGNGPCPRSGILGGCQLVPNEIDWYYGGGSYSSAGDVMSLCSRTGATFVTVPAQ